MATTIQVTENIANHLRRIKDTLKAPSYNDAIAYLIRQETARKSFWGAGKRKLNMKQILEDLRDESDRF